MAIYYLETEKCHISEFSDLFNFCGRDLEKFALLLRKGVMCYEYIDSRGKLKEKSSPPKEKFFSRLIKTRNMCKRLKEKEDYVYFCNMQDVLTSLGFDINLMKNMSENFNLKTK